MILYIYMYIHTISTRFVCNHPSFSWKHKLNRETPRIFGFPRAPAELSAGIGRDWPDARGAFVMEGLSRTLYVELPVKHKGKPKMGSFFWFCSEKMRILDLTSQICRMQSSQLG